MRIAARYPGGLA